MGRFLSYWTSKFQNSHFGPILGHNSGQINILVPKFLHMVENIVFHLFKSKSQILWAGFWVMELQSRKKPNFWSKMAPKWSKMVESKKIKNVFSFLSKESFLKISCKSVKALQNYGRTRTPTTPTDEKWRHKVTAYWPVT